MFCIADKPTAQCGVAGVDVIDRAGQHNLARLTNTRANTLFIRRAIVDLPRFVQSGQFECSGSNLWSIG